MGQASSIEWTDATWNPVVGCEMVSPGCAHCYAETMSNRLAGMARKDAKAGKLSDRKTHYLHVIKENGRWNGNIELVPEALTDPFGWKRPRKVFVNSMSDLFHKDVPFEFIDKVFAVMALTPHHTYQILTKRPERMADYLNEFRRPALRVWNAAWTYPDWSSGDTRGGIEAIGRHQQADHVEHWPLPNVWIGTSIENQDAMQRTHHLRQCPAVVRFISAEPLLGAVDIDLVGIRWVIVGGESGAGARQCYVEWVRSIVDRCHEDGVAVFVKQLGGNVVTAEQPSDRRKRFSQPGDWDCGEFRPAMQDRKGGDPSEWPEDLRVQEMPTAQAPSQPAEV